MKKTVSILTALLLAVSPAAQRAYAQEATTQAQQNVEESKASKVWNTVREHAGKAANAVAENKGVIAGAVGVTGAVALLGAGSFATYNGVTMQKSIKTIWTADGITMAQKVQLIAKVLFLRKEISATELANLKNRNIISASSAAITEIESVIKSADEKLNGIAKVQKDLDGRKATLEKNKLDAESNLKDACAKCKAAEGELGETDKCDKACYN